jgi:hypothetical protein
MIYRAQPVSEKLQLSLDPRTRYLRAWQPGMQEGQLVCEQVERASDLEYENNTKLSKNGIAGRSLPGAPN